ncbi:2-succinyl-5-enolpyruvyl-6-hydroxy-3-cyclohexene-1-carboxylic-acid synthase [Marinilabiliaceae bacterium ANBcel2]|nr:2-succinyl-5-enolpyruvyl-6-hydroxy-3-cyclohexene-1-carboxylic-acid synthase [Marinilabiliaceae bacterium ANBcel2]
MSKPISDKPIVKALVELCHLYGVEQVVISPGSRNAPLIISFTGYGKFECLSIVDERSAGYFALGLAREKKRPVALVCTSGTAALNYSPAIAEAFYQQIPLVAITADRPKEWVDQLEGQTINQPGIYNNFVRYQCSLPLSGGHSDDEWYMNRMLNEAFQKGMGPVPGPIHINVPMREPLYGKTVYPDKPVRKIKTLKGDSLFSQKAVDELVAEIDKYQRVMILTGAMDSNPQLKEVLASLAEKGVVVLTETLSNIEDPNFFSNIDRAASTIDDNEHLIFSPDILITLDAPVLSKMIKKILRDKPARIHWHFSNQSNITDSYQSLTRIIKGDGEQILKQVAEKLNPREKRFKEVWRNRTEKSTERHKQFFNNLEWCDLKLFKLLSEQPFNNMQIHLGNSTPVRYAQLFNWNEGNRWYANRGTSGIDGSISTAAGAAYQTDKPLLLITGDLSFFYDSNGLWNKYLSPNLKIIVINNQGGGIFRFLQGPSESDVLDFFETKQDLSCEGVANTFSLNYFTCKNEDEFSSKMEQFLSKNDKPSILEVFTPGKENGKLLKKYFKFLNNEI